ncbi:hypothetical protein ACWOFH_07555 [Aerococcus christensenii]
MEQDITPKLWESIQKTFWQNLKEVKKGKSYKDADNYADLVGQAMAKAFHDNAVDLPNDKMYFNIADRIINGALRQSHQLVSNYTADAQTALNKQAGLGIKGLTADMDESKAKNLVEVACHADRYADVAPKVEQAMTSFARSVVVDTMKKNVDFHHKLGLSPKIVRKLGPGTSKKRSNSRCEFCRERVGTFEYNKKTIDKEIFRRHAHCTCSIEYFPHKGAKAEKVKAWQSMEEEEKRKEIKKQEKEKENAKIRKNKRIARSISRQSLKELKPVEKRVTADLKAIAKKNDSQLSGLEYRLKTVDSLARKIVLDSKEKGIGLEEASELIHDKLRYTMLKGPKAFTDNYFKTVEALNIKGYTMVRVKNTFKKGAVYKGINTLVKEPSGEVFELQFHTPQSAKIKENELHKLYEEQRILDKRKDLEKYQELKQKMVKLSDQIIDPLGIERID